MTTDIVPITVTAYRWVPAFAQGLVRDLRVRWALEEAGLPYRVELIDLKQKDSAEYLAWQPFGQVPAYEQEGIKFFESGAIVLHIAEQSDVLMPPDAAGRARVRTWLFAALNSIEPSVQELTGIDLFHGDEAWTGQRRPQVESTVRKRLGALAAWLGEREYLETRYTAADLLMVTVLRNLRHTDLLAQFPTLKAHSERCEARPAFQKALRGQMADFVQDPVAA
ncbi:MAG TPA: glutathione S-transferase family protein [Rhodanobacter sp.]|nr:glutathione S-transferase family protein [Rhodanobacter sp.]